MAGGNPIAQVQTSNKDVNQLQKNISQAVAPLTANPVNTGIIVQNVALAIGDNTVETKLGRKIQGWQIARQIGPFSQITETSENFDILVLHSSAATTVNLYVF